MRHLHVRNFQWSDNLPYIQLFLEKESSVCIKLTVKEHHFGVPSTSQGHAFSFCVTHLHMCVPSTVGWPATLRGEASSLVTKHGTTTALFKAYLDHAGCCAQNLFEPQDTRLTWLKHVQRMTYSPWFSTVTACGFCYTDTQVAIAFLVPMQPRQLAHIQPLLMFDHHYLRSTITNKQCSNRGVQLALWCSMQLLTLFWSTKTHNSSAKWVVIRCSSIAPFGATKAAPAIFLLHTRSLVVSSVWDMLTTHVHWNGYFYVQ